MAPKKRREAFVAASDKPALSALEQLVAEAAAAEASAGRRAKKDALRLLRDEDLAFKERRHTAVRALRRLRQFSSGRRFSVPERRALENCV